MKNDTYKFEKGDKAELQIRSNIKEEDLTILVDALKDFVRKNPIVDTPSSYLEASKIKLYDLRSELNTHTNKYNIFLIGVVV